VIFWVVFSIDAFGTLSYCNRQSITEVKQYKKIVYINGLKVSVFFIQQFRPVTTGSPPIPNNSE